MTWIVRTLFLSTALIFSACVVGQDKKPGFVAGAYITRADPKGGFDKSYSFSGGVEAFGGVGSGNTYLMGSLGYSAFFAKSGTHAGTVAYVPFKVGIRQYFIDHHIFINGDLGIAAVKNKGTTRSRFTRGIGAGAKLLGVEIALYYDGWKNIGPGFSNSIYGKFGYSFAL